MENQNVVEPYNGISLSNKKEQSSDTCHNINEPENIMLKREARDFPDGPVAKTSHSQCRGPEFEPWSRN